MDGIHDMGGTDGFPHPDPDSHEQHFNHPWERIAFTLMPAIVGQNIANMHEFRHGSERMGVHEYLETPYYEHWLSSFERLLIEKEILTDDEVSEKLKQVDDPTATREQTGGSGPDKEAVMKLIKNGKDRGEPTDDTQFEVGERVQVKNHHPQGHTRCPNYVRRATGTVDTVHQEYLLPDANAHDEKHTEPVYSVAFSPQELWGSNSESNETVYVDMWESYLQPITMGDKND